MAGSLRSQRCPALARLDSHRQFGSTRLMHPRLFALLAFAFLTAPPALLAAEAESKPAPDAGTQDELKHLETTWNSAHVAGDAAALDALWADELVVTVPKMPPVSYTHLRAHETPEHLVCRL